MTERIPKIGPCGRCLRTLAVLPVLLATAACNTTNTRAESTEPTWFDSCVMAISDLDRHLPSSARHKIVTRIEHCEGGPLSSEERTRLSVAKAIFAFETGEAEVFRAAVDGLDDASLVTLEHGGDSVEMVERLKNIRRLQASRGMSHPARDLLNAARFRSTYFE